MLIAVFSASKHELSVIIVETTSEVSTDNKKKHELIHAISFINVFQIFAASNVARGSVVG
jgi:hypothetical protein